VWVGQVNLQAGNHLLAVDYDDEAVAEKIRARCAPWSSDDEREIPAAFGVRTVKVGFLRRTAALLHHGAPIRARFDDLDDALDVLVSFLGEIEQLDMLSSERPGDVAVDARAFVRNGKMALLHAPLTLDIDERRLAKLAIEEIHTWRPRVDPAAGTVTVGDRSWPLAGVVMVGHSALSLDDARRHVWALGSPSEVGWAERIDALGDRVGTSELDVYDALDDALD